MIFTLPGSSDSLIINVLQCRSRLKFLNFIYCEKIFLVPFIISFRLSQTSFKIPG